MKISDFTSSTKVLIKKIQGEQQEPLKNGQEVQGTLFANLEKDQRVKLINTNWSKEKDFTTSVVNHIIEGEHEVILITLNSRYHLKLIS